MSTVRGVWFLPAAPEHVVRGELTCHSREGMTLDLIGGGLTLRPQDAAEHVIHGIADSGEKVSLLSAFRTHTTSRAPLPGKGGLQNIKSQTWTLSEFLIGSSFFDPFSRVTSFSLTTERLPLWIGQLPVTFSDASSTSFDMSLTLPDRATFSTPGCTGSIGWHETGRSLGDRHYSIDFGGSICLEFDEPCHIEEVWHDWVVPLTLFTILCHGESDRIAQLFVTTDITEPAESGRSFDQTLEWVQSAWRGDLPRPSSTFTVHDFLPFETIRDSLDEVLTGWFDLFSTARYSLLQHFSTQVSDSKPFFEEEFSSRVRALESFHRSVHGGSYLDSQVFSGIVDEIRERYDKTPIDEGAQTLGSFLRDRLLHANTFSLKKRLDELLKDSGEVLNADEEAWRRGHRAMVGTRDSLVHNSTFGSAMTLDQIGHSLAYLDELFRASVLRALGFDHSQVDAALSRRPSRRLRLPAQWSFDKNFRAGPDFDDPSAGGPRP